ncbi:D-isomer specific 2-hydroxyacid dehydrogenase family protein [Corynebacterium bovis]|uniref:D-isomer specific 2-hydroxyacid dehydrogenase family protein n=1 Tax=Corynebacterium bovis TaxID=36808 RepID=UPI00313A1588
MRVFIGKDPLPQTSDALREAGATLVDTLGDAEAFICSGVGREGFPDLPDSVRWVQLCQAGIESFIDAGVVTRGPDGTRRWSNASGIYGLQVAESAVGLLLNVLHLHTRIARERTWDIAKEVDRRTRWLHGTTVGIIGAGGIGGHLIEMLATFGAETVAVNMSGRTVDGARETYPYSRIDEVWPQVDHLILSAPLTDETRGLVDADALAACRDGVTVVNVARGAVVDTDALVEALRSGKVSGAGLDVTDPEPLPDDHPLWGMDTVAITTHGANTKSSMDGQLAPVVAENYRRFTAGETMVTELDPDRGY